MFRVFLVNGYTFCMSNSQRHAKNALRRMSTFAAIAGVSAALLSAPVAPVASAQEAPGSAEQLSSASSTGSLDAFVVQVNATFQAIGENNDRAARDAAWNTRTSLRQQADGLGVLNPTLPEQAKLAIDGAVESMFPGLIAERTPKPAPAPAPEPVAAAAPAAAPAFDYGPCPKDAKVCVDIDGRRSWLQSGGEMYYQAATIGPGAPGSETPRGTFWVNRKVKDEISYEFNNAPMPFATYFTYNGIAFHEGNPGYLSNGCVRMYRADAERYFNDLQIGDKVFVY